MIITDVQERIKDVFSRATKSLSGEFQEITRIDLLQEKISLHESIEVDFKNYASLAVDLLEEVNYNLSSNLRPSEREKYVINLNSYTYWIKDGYDYIESDEWVDKILASFGTLSLINTDKKRPQLTDVDKKIIITVAEKVRECCYEYVKAADIIDSLIRDYLICHAITPLRKTRNIAQSPSFNFRPSAENDSMTTSTTTQSAQSSESITKLQWRDNRGDKTDFAELVWTLAKSHRIIDNETGKPVTIDVLANQLGALFGIKISNPMQLMQGRKDSYKAAEDGLTFISTLADLVEKYVTDK